MSCSRSIYWIPVEKSLIETVDGCLPRNMKPHAPYMHEHYSYPGDNKPILSDRHTVNIPIVVEEPNVLAATGRLSRNDYHKTIMMNMRSAGSNEVGGFPALLPLLATLAPLIPVAIRGAKNLIHKIRGKGLEAGYIPTNPNIKSLHDLQRLYDSSV